jgi:HPt (histidine-containing phosphotransfer) domain-containing protein
MSATETAVPLIDRSCIDEIRHIERVTGRGDVLAGFVAMLERNVAAFPAAFADCLARGDGPGAARAAHTLKGACRQLGAQALGDLFAEVESCAKAADYAGAQRRFDGGATLVAQSLQALRTA